MASRSSPKPALVAASRLAIFLQQLSMRVTAQADRVDQLVVSYRTFGAYVKRSNVRLHVGRVASSLSITLSLSMWVAKTRSAARRGRMN